MECNTSMRPFFYGFNPRFEDKDNLASFGREALASPDKSLNLGLLGEVKTSLPREFLGNARRFRTLLANFVLFKCVI